MTHRLILAALLFAAPAFAETPAPRAGEALNAQVLEPGLAMLSGHGPAAWRAEAVHADAWRAGRAGIRVEEEGLRDATGAFLTVTPAFAKALNGMNDYFGLTGPTLANPVTIAELKAAFLAPAGAASVRAAFDRVMSDSIRVAGKAHLPEIGGELTLDGVLGFHFVKDPTRPALKDLLARRDDPAALRRLFIEQPEAMKIVDKMGILSRHLAKRAEWDASGKLSLEKRDALLKMTLDLVAESAANHYSGDYGTQIEMMASDEWSGRYVGPWHSHPPDAGTASWEDSVPPSDADYEAAAKRGQEIVVVFLADGFDVYELSAAASGATWNSIEPFASHRSPEWRDHFQAAFDRVAR